MNFAIWMVLGTAVGAAIGAATGQVAIGVGVGAAMGAGLGAAFGVKRRLCPLAFSDVCASHASIQPRCHHGFCRTPFKIAA